MIRLIASVFIGTTLFLPLANANPQTDGALSRTADDRTYTAYAGSDLSMLATYDGGLCYSFYAVNGVNEQIVLKQWPDGRVTRLDDGRFNQRGQLNYGGYLSAYRDGVPLFVKFAECAP